MFTLVNLIKTQCCRHRYQYQTGYDGYINFHHNPSVYKTLFSYENSCPSYLYSPSKSSLVWDNYDNTMLVCESSLPTEGTWESKKRLRFPRVDDSTHVTDNRLQYLVTAEGTTGVAMYTRGFHREEWRVTGKPFRLEKEKHSKSVTTDGRGNLYVYHSANECILLFHTNGTY